VLFKRFQRLWYDWFLLDHATEDDFPNNKQREAVLRGQAFNEPAEISDPVACQESNPLMHFQGPLLKKSSPHPERRDE